jgi:hypothetical protein
MNLFPENDIADQLQQRTIALIEPLIPPDAHDRVVSAVKEFNKIVLTYPLGDRAEAVRRESQRNSAGQNRERFPARGRSVD